MRLILAATFANLPFGTIYAFSVFLKSMEAMLSLTRSDMGVIFGEDFEADEAVVDEDRVAHGDVVDEILIVDVDGSDFLRVFAIGAGLDGEIKDLAGTELDGCVDVTGANFGTLDIHHDGDLAADTGAHGADATDDGARPLMFGVGHVQPDDVGTAEDEFLEHLLALRSGTKSEDDFGTAENRLRLSHGKSHTKQSSRGMLALTFQFR